MSAKNAYGIIALAGLAATLAPAANNKLESMSIVVDAGIVSFVSDTNVPAISVKGKSTALHAQANVRRTAEGLQIEGIRATVPVKSLATGMGLRDEHMRKYIFTTPDGQTPDVRFEAENAACPAGHDVTCRLNGSLTIRGATRPFSMPLKIRDDGALFKAAGDATVKLSDYGIERPTQLGVTTVDEVHLHFEFTARQPAGDTASAGGFR